MCVNTAGSYYCSCISGFTLSSNGRTCIGELTERLTVVYINVLFYSKQIEMSVQMAMGDASKHVRILLGHSTALAKLGTILTVTFAPVMISMNVLLVTHALVNVLIPLDHSSADVLVIKHMIQSLTDVLHQTTVLVIHVSIDALVVAVLITAIVCRDMI